MVLEKIISRSLEYSRELTFSLQKQSESIRRISLVIAKAYENQKKVLFFGNGGSAAEAQHLAAELTGKYYMERKSLPAIALSTNSSTVTALGNDFGFSNIFKKQIEGLGDQGDVAIGMSTSGESENVIQALKLARELGLSTVGFTGKGGGKMKEIADCCLQVPSDDTPRVQEGHILVGHIICEIVEKRLFGKNE